MDSGISGLYDAAYSEPREKRGNVPEFKPSTRLYLAFLTLAVITMAVALDGTSLSVALPVSFPLIQSEHAAHDGMI